MTSATAEHLLASALCELVFSGRYTEVLKRTVDSRSGEHRPEDTPFVVGALAFSGRQDEAVAALRWWSKTHGNDATISVASHFFLAIGECRSGRYDAAIEQVRAIVRNASHTDALHSFFAHQALGVLRHFTGRARRAAKHAARARQAALEARFSYGRMLALDLLGHALVAEGQIHAGLAVLAQSADLAESLGLVANAGAPRTAAAAYRARYGVEGAAAVATLGALVAAMKPEDAYSRRMLLTELAIQQAFAGNGPAARATMDEAARIALPDGDRRAKVRLLVSDAIVTGFARGRAAAREKTAFARSLLDPALDDALDVEVTWAEAVVRGTLVSPVDEERTRIEALARRTHAGRARLLSEGNTRAAPVDPHGEDRIASLLELVAVEPDEARHRIVTHGLWGWLPTFFQLEPGRRLFLLHAESLLVVEDHGTVVPLELPGAVLVRLLEAIARCPMQKDELVHAVWGIKMYRAERHDSLVHTTMSRLRAAIGPAGAWIRATDAGYALADGVTLVHHRGDVGDNEPRVATSEPAPAANGAASRQQKALDERRARILDLVAKGPVSTSDIASELRISEMTALRLLSTMSKDGLVERTGQGKLTRYRVRP